MGGTIYTLSSMFHRYYVLIVDELCDAFSDDCWLIFGLKERRGDFERERVGICYLGFEYLNGDGRCYVLLSDILFSMIN
jgi:hypothetical protein